MLKFVPYEPWHIRLLDLPAEQDAARRKHLTPEKAEAISQSSWAWTGMDFSRVVGCAGITPQWEGRAVLWAFFGKISKNDWCRIVRKIKFETDAAYDKGIRRLELSVASDFGAGCRLAHLLGFTVEGKLTAYGPDGKDHFMYAKVNR